MTDTDLHNLMKVFFTRNGFKMWRNEKRMQQIDGVWMAVPGIGYPTGSPDLVGYRLSDCRVAWCEDKTLNDTLKKKQKEQMKRVIGSFHKAV